MPPAEQEPIEDVDEHTQPIMAGRDKLFGLIGGNLLRQFDPSLLPSAPASGNGGDGGSQTPRTPSPIAEREVARFAVTESTATAHTLEFKRRSGNNNFDALVGPNISGAVAISASADRLIYVALSSGGANSFNAIGVNFNGLDTAFTAETSTTPAYDLRISNYNSIASTFGYHGNTIAVSVGKVSTPYHSKIRFGTVEGQPGAMSIDFASVAVDFGNAASANLYITHMTISNNVLIAICAAGPGQTWVGSRVYAATISGVGKSATIGTPQHLSNVSPSNIRSIDISGERLSVMTNSQLIFYRISVSGSTISATLLRATPLTDLGLTSLFGYDVASSGEVVLFHVKASGRRASNQYILAEVEHGNVFTPVLSSPSLAGFSVSGRYILAPITINGVALRGFRVKIFRTIDGGADELLRTVVFDITVSGHFLETLAGSRFYHVDRHLAVLQAHQIVSVFHGQAVGGAGQILYIDNNQGRLSTGIYFVVFAVTGDGFFEGSASSTLVDFNNLDVRSIVPDGAKFVIQDPATGAIFAITKETLQSLFQN